MGKTLREILDEWFCCEDCKFIKDCSRKEMCKKQIKEYYLKEIEKCRKDKSNIKAYCSNDNEIEYAEYGFNIAIDCVISKQKGSE